MAFGFSNSSSTAMGGNTFAPGEISTGPDLEVIQTEGIGFLAIAGDAKVQLTSKWQTDPSPSSSLLSIASRKGLVAAAGPDALYIATTESVRKAFAAPKTGDSNVLPFQPQAKVSLPTRVSQVAFTADEQFLVLSAESGGGLAVYDVQSLTQGSSSPAFELPTNSEALRSLVPNPAPELAFSCGLVTEKGNLLMANLKERSLKQLASQVACAAWSTKGKQLVAGLADGTVRQMTPDGADKGALPKPPGLGDYHVSSVVWLENNVFLVIHTPSTRRDKSIYHIITRNVNPPGFVFQKMTDPVDPFIDDKIPHHLLSRLKDFSPTLHEVLLVSSTASESLGLLTRSQIPLSNDKRAATITDVFTTTELADDSRRAQIPMSEDGMSDTFSIGLAVDLSAKDSVYKPIPTDEIEQSPGPLPGVWALSNEGVLAAWWIVHNESIRSSVSYPHLAVLEGNAMGNAGAASSSPARPIGATPASGTAFGAASPLGSKPAFGSSAFGASPAPAVPAFGAPSFGASSFGSRPAAAPAFGQSGLMGMGAKVPSPWATGSTSAAAPAFGQSGLGLAAPSGGKVFGSASTAAPSSGGFAAFANNAGFASVGSSPAGGSIFGTPNKPTGTFGSGNPDVSMDTDSAFLAPGSKPAGSSGFGSSPFVLGTTFKADPKTANENDAPKAGGGGSMFDSGFLSLGDTPKPPAANEGKDADMDAPTPADDKPKSIFASTTPTTTPAAQKFATPATAGPTTGFGLFGQKSSLFGTPAKEPLGLKAGEKQTVKEEEDKENVPEAPLPPTTTSKTAYPLGESSSSSGTSRGSPETVSKTPLRENDAARVASTHDATPSAAGRGFSTPEARDFAATKSTKFVTEDAPLPPDPFAKPKAKASSSSSAAAQDTFLPKLPTVNVPAVPAAPESDDGEEGDEELSGEDQDEGLEPDKADDGQDGEEELESEGSGVDVANDISPTTTTTAFGGQTPGFTPQSSFAGMGGSTFSTLSRASPEQPRPQQEQRQQQQPSQQRALFGEINRNAPAPLLPRPQPVSPRSPSPVRSAIPPNLLRPEASRSVSAPGMASQLLGASGRKALPNKPPAVPLAQARSAQPTPDTTVAFEDPEDDARQMELNADIEPSLDIAEFLAVESRLPELGGTSPNLGQAVVSLFRDVNRMLDTLGLNARSLKSFIKGHTELGKANGRSKEDLDIQDDWVLCEAEDCKDILEQDLAPALEEGRVQDVDAALRSIEVLARDVAKLRGREEDVKRVVAVHMDPGQVAAGRSLPLSTEQAAQQNDLRRAYTNFSRLLAQAEEELTVLRAKVASSSAGTGAASRTAVPTVEAVMRTIAKMTSMAEKRSGDVDLLETQMRKLRLGGSMIGGNSPSSREGSPRAQQSGPGAAATPQRRSMLAGLDGSPRNSFRTSSATPPPLSSASPRRRKMTQFSDEEKAHIRQKRAQREVVLQRFRTAVHRAGPNVSRLTDDDG